MEKYISQLPGDQSDSNDVPAELPCIDKLVFDTQRQAEASATVVLYRYGTKVRVYTCRYCHLWHLSSSSQD